MGVFLRVRCRSWRRCEARADAFDAPQPGTRLVDELCRLGGRKFITGMRLWPPARSFASQPLAARAASAAGSESGPGTRKGRFHRIEKSNWHPRVTIAPVIPSCGPPRRQLSRRAFRTAWCRGGALRDRPQSADFVPCSIEFHVRTASRTPSGQDLRRRPLFLPPQRSRVFVQGIVLQRDRWCSLYPRMAAPHGRLVARCAVDSRPDPARPVVVVVWRLGRALFGSNRIARRGGARCRPSRC